MRPSLFWLNYEQWQGIAPLLPSDVRGKERGDDRRVISGILHVLKSGCRWCDCPPEYGPPTTIHKSLREVGAARRLGESVPRAAHQRPHAVPCLDGVGRGAKHCWIARVTRHARNVASSCASGTPP